MSTLIIDDLVDSWTRQPGLRARVVSWQWFEAASMAALEQAAARHGLSVRVDTEVLCRAFFDWAHAVEMQESLEPRDPLDFRHAMTGLLLQQLFAAHNAVHGGPLFLLHKSDGAAEQGQDEPALLFTSFALTLLQALRLQAGAQPLTLDRDLPNYWHSYRENAAQNPGSAICFLDRMTGLDPVWQSPTAIGARPAMHSAAAGVTASS